MNARPLTAIKTGPHAELLPGFKYPPQPKCDAQEQYAEDGKASRQYAELPKIRVRHVPIRCTAAAELCTEATAFAHMTSA
jgi:hypothetical protein